MTLIELLLALALLGVLMGVGVSWITTSSGLAREQSDRLRWERSANALLQAIHDDLATGEFNLARDNAPPTRRLQAQSGELAIRTRERGEEIRRIYRFDASTGELRTWTVAADTRVSPSTPSGAAIVLAGLRSFEAELDDLYTTLDVQIAGPENSGISRTFRIGAVP